MHSLKLKSPTHPNLITCWKWFSEVVNDSGGIVFGVACATIVTNVLLTKTDFGRVTEHEIKNLKHHTRNSTIRQFFTRNDRN